MNKPLATNHPASDTVVHGNRVEAWKEENRREMYCGIGVYFG